jgi:hypothetical protein
MHGRYRRLAWKAANVSRIAVASRLQAAMIRGFHGTGEVSNDLTEIHDREATALARPRLLNPRIMSQARLCSKLSGSVRSFGLSWLIRSVRYVQIQRYTKALLLAGPANDLTCSVGASRRGGQIIAPAERQPSRGKEAAVKVVSTAFAASVLALATVGCGHTSENASQAAHPVTHEVTSAAPSPTATTSGNSTVNERAFADALASTASLIPSGVISGPVMRAYRLGEYEINAAHAATGNPFSAETVTPIPGGYQLCLPDIGAGAQCGDITQFVTNSAGQITGVSVGGVPVEGRIATGSSSQMAGLMVSGIVAYLSLLGGSKVYVTFKAQDVSYKPINSNPACLATFSTRDGTYNADNFNSALPSTLAPGETVYGLAIFNTTQVTGTFSLHSNDGYNRLLASSTLTKLS